MTKSKQDGRSRPTQLVVMLNEQERELLDRLVSKRDTSAQLGGRKATIRETVIEALMLLEVRDAE